LGCAGSDSHAENPDEITAAAGAARSSRLAGPGETELSKNS
jgi:hypothetical protein